MPAIHDNDSILHDPLDATRNGANIFEGISIDCDKIGIEARSDGTELCLKSQ